MTVKDKNLPKIETFEFIKNFNFYKFYANLIRWSTKYINKTEQNNTEYVLL